MTFTGLEVRFGEPPEESGGVSLLVFAGDRVTPRARISFRDLGRRGGVRPLNLTWDPSEPLPITAVDPAGVWADRVPCLELRRRWGRSARAGIAA